MLPQAREQDSAGRRGGTEAGPERRSSHGARAPDTSTRDKDNAQIVVALIDPRPVIRASLVYLLQDALVGKDPSVHFQLQDFGSATDFLGAFSGRSPEMIIVSTGAACIGDALVADEIQQLRSRVPEASLVLLSDIDEPAYILDGIRRGISGYIPTTVSPPVAIQALRLVHAGGTFIPSDALLGLDEQATGPGTRSPGLDPNAGSFTPRQTQVLQRLREGKSNKVIAYELNIQEGTVKVYVQQIMKKLRANNRTHAAFLISQAFGDSD